MQEWECRVEEEQVGRNCQSGVSIYWLMTDGREMRDERSADDEQLQQTSSVKILS